MAAADYRLMSEATGQRIAAALEALSGFGAYLTTADVVNNLTRQDTDKPASQKEVYDLNKSGLKVEVVHAITSYISPSPETAEYIDMPLPSDSTAINMVYIPICCTPQSNYNSYATVAHVDGRRFYINAGGSGSQPYNIFAAIIYTN